MFTNLLKRFLDDQSGQGITEYGAILAFVALLIAVVFTAANGTLQTAISTAFSNVTNQLTLLNGVAAS